jgi:hypothetical protein
MYFFVLYKAKNKGILYSIGILINLLFPIIPYHVCLEACALRRHSRLLRPDWAAVYGKTQKPRYRLPKIMRRFRHAEFARDALFTRIIFAPDISPVSASFIRYYYAPK